MLVRVIPDATKAWALRAALLLAGVAVTWFWWAGTPREMGTTPGTALLAGGELVGLLASVLVCVQLLLVAHVPWVDRALGPGLLVPWHASLGTTVALLIVTHVVAMVGGYGLVDHGTPWHELATLLARVDALPLALVGTLLMLAAAATSARAVRAWLGRTRWTWVHVTVYGGIYLAFFHQVLAGAHFVAHPVAQAVWVVLYAGSGAAVVRWRIVPGLRERARAGRHDRDAERSLV